MLFPVRCFSCSKVLAHHEKTYTGLVESKVNPEEIFKILRVKRYCCKRMFLGYVNIQDKMLQYPKEFDYYTEVHN